MDKYLIINADDFGMCHAANAAVFDLFGKGGITSATVMTPCSWSVEALHFAAAHPEYAIGVHLTFTSEWGDYRWRPVSAAPCPGLRDEDGFMHRTNLGVESHASLAEVEAEIRAQVTFAKKLGLSPSHLDNHMGSLYGLEQQQCFLPLVFSLCAEYGLPFRFPRRGHPAAPPELNAQIAGLAALADRCGVLIPEHLWEHEWDGAQSESYESFREYMLEWFHHIPNGVVETYIHPSLECDELKGTSSVWYRRVWEHRLFADPATRRHMEALGIKLISYRDLQRMQKA